MKTYKIHITNKAEKDIISTINYIELVLKNPQAADNLLDTVISQINKLELFPLKHTLVNDPIISSWGIRFITVNNYLVFYLVDNDKHLVHIVRFLYCKSDWKSILKNGIVL